MGDEEMKAASGSSGSDSDSEGEFEVGNISEADLARVMKLESALEENPNQYDVHVQYIDLLRRVGMKERLREARTAMHALFPLGEQLWLDWVGDELEGVAGEEDIPRLRALLEEAVGDYLSIPLWLQLLGLAKELDPEVSARAPEGLARLRDLCERALTAGGLHVSAGSQLWEAYRAIEEELYEEAPSPEQAERVRALFHRQLAVPLADGAQALEAYKQWEAGLPGRAGQDFKVPDAVAAAYAKAQKLLDLRRPYEEAVCGEGRSPDAELLAAYMAYAKAEEAQGDPARVQVIFERALGVFPVTHYLWLQYASYLEAHLKIPAVILAAYQRAVRNCPWVGELWARYLRALERFGADEERHAAVYQQALAAGLQSYEELLGVALARLDFLRRRGNSEALRAAFKQAGEQLAAAFPDAPVDRAYRLTQYWADCEAKAGDLKAARGVWEAALKSQAGRYADCWVNYVALERRLGHIREARGVFKRGYSRRLEEGGQAALCEAWLRFEREEGSADDYAAAWQKVEPILTEAAAAQAAVAADAAAKAEARRAAERAPKLSKEEMKRMRQEKDPNFAKRKGGQKRKAEGEARAPAGVAPGAEGGGGMGPPPPKKPKMAEAQQAQQSQNAAPAAAAAAAAGGEGKQEAEAGEAGAGAERHASVSARGLRKTGPTTVFVKHLADNVGEPEVEELFAPCGKILALKLGRDDSGRSRGFAYVEFSSEEEMRKACEELNGREVQGKMLMVAHSQPPQGGGGRGRGRGDFGGGRGRGRGFGGGRGRGREWSGRGPAAHHRTHLDVSETPGGAAGGGHPVTGFMPRSVQQKRDETPKSNEEFRKMMLGGK